MALALLPPPERKSHSLLHYLPPPSPQLRPTVMDSQITNRPSLPSISSLIEAVADQTEPGSAHSPTRTDQARRISGGSQGQSAISPDRPSIPSPRSHPPPTPPLPPASSFDFPRGPDTNVSPTSAPPRNSFYPTTPSSTNPELYAQRNSAYPPIPEPGSSYPPIPDSLPWSASRTSAEHGPREPSRPPPTSQGEHMENGQYPGLAQQRPLPVNFPPPLSGQSGPPIDPQMGPPPTWQHHHYYPPANPPSYPQTQERYICPTCNKPFSRPSSLKIHTYSHTGEKPYKCKHEGCGKHFSVRSNMKRHEKGCHGGESASTSGASPKTN